MAQKNETLPDLLESLRLTAADPRLKRVMADAEPGQMVLWVVETKQQQQRGYQLLYGWVLASTFQNRSAWSTVKLSKDWSKLGEEGSRYRLWRVTLTAMVSSITDVVKGLCEGTGFYP
jgi:hypothetical protein